MSIPFEQKRRQPFITEAFYKVQLDYREKIIPELVAELSNPENKLENWVHLTSTISERSFERLSLHYTAGEPIEPLRAELETVIAAYERYTGYLREYEERPHFPGLSFNMIDEYVRCMQLIGLCYLLHRRDLLPRIAAMQDPNYGGRDLFYEEFMEYGMEGRADIDTSYHGEEYLDLYLAMYADTDDESIQNIQDFLPGWYTMLKNLAPWHDGHLGIKGTEGYYFGYWAFEAGAVAYLLELDDASITHMVYPKDIVTWARANQHLAYELPPTALHLRVEAGQPCPREGYYFTPAKIDSRKLFKQGEIMPEVGGDYGATIWQLDNNQDK